MKKILAVACTMAIAPITTFAESAGDYPVIVIGSGYGGSIAAYNLAQKKVPTLVLERGDWWTVEDTSADEPFPNAMEVLANDFDPTTSDGDPRVGWLRHACGGNLYATLIPPLACDPQAGLLELVASTKDPAAGASVSDFSPDLTAHGITPLTAAGVGGGSLVNNGVTFMPTKGMWDVAYPPEELPHMQQVWDELVSGDYFQRALDKLDPAKPPADILATDYYAGTSTMYGFFGSLGYPELDPSNPDAINSSHRTFAPVIVDWDAVRQEMTGARVASIINGEAWWGVNSGAKKSLDTEKGYLGKALKSGYVDVKALHTVSDITYDDQAELYTITAVRTDKDYNEIETVELTTPHLIMAAGSLGTTKLLLRARDNGSLPDLNEHVGTRFSSNGNTGGFAVLRSPDDVSLLGPLQQGGPAGVKIFDNSDPGNPVVFENLPAPQPGAFQFAPDLQVFLGAVSLVGIGIPTKTGEFSYDPLTDSVALNWPTDGALNVREKFESVFSNLGAGFIDIGDSSQSFTLHPLGGVPLGLATDLSCQLEGYEGLYAVDGSIIPGSAAATNPTGLISALSERCMKAIAKDISKQYKNAGSNKGNKNQG